MTECEWVCVCVCVDYLRQEIVADIVWVRELKLYSHNTHTMRSPSHHYMYIYLCEYKKPLAYVFDQAHIQRIFSTVFSKHFFFRSLLSHSIRQIRNKNEKWFFFLFFCFWCCLITYLNRNAESKVPKNLKGKNWFLAFANTNYTLNFSEIRAFWFVSNVFHHFSFFYFMDI